MRMRKAAGRWPALVLLVSLLTTGCAVKPVINDDPESVGAGRPSSSAGTTNAPDNTDPTAPTDTTASTESTDASRPTGSTTANAEPTARAARPPRPRRRAAAIPSRP